MKKVLTGNQAVAHAVVLSEVQVVAAYPITPQTSIIETLAELLSRGAAGFEYIRVESEHSALAACISASLGGVRAFTATCGQGLFLMHEMLHYASGSRVPLVLANVNRAAAAPWSIWTDQTDSVSQRDTGWVQLYCEGNQEVFDTTIMAFKIAERLRLPVMVVLDAFFLSHTAEPIAVPKAREVRAFLPPFDPGEFWLDPAEPKVFNPIVMTDAYMEFRWLVQRDMEKAKSVITEVHQEFSEAFGREYAQIEGVGLDDAEVVLVCTGTVASTGRAVLKELRAEGKKAGLLKIKTLRPFPAEAAAKMLAGRKKVAVIDRNFSPGGQGVWGQELKSALYDLSDSERPAVYDYIAGLGGRDISLRTIREVFDLTAAAERPEDRDIWLGVRYVQP
ncbi:MAG: pyruvate ferredoxin oxidoreductase [Desulfobacteraceae bacterium]